MKQINYSFNKHTFNMSANINKYSTLASFIFMSLIFFTKNSYTQKEIDTLYLYSDTVNFYNKAAFVTDDVCGLSLKFISPENWEEYYINQILVVIPDSIEISEESFTISIGNFPRDSIIYTKSVNMYPSFPEFHSFELNPPPLIKNQQYFFLSDYFLLKAAISENMEKPIIGHYFCSKLLGWIESFPVYFQVKVIVKRNTSGINEEIQNPAKFQLFQNYPNPFNPSTEIRYQISEGRNVKLIIYDILGNEVETLVNEFKDAGSHSIKFDASRLPSGIYYYKLIAGDFIKTKKMLFLK